jgi:hypothetical protein
VRERARGFLLVAATLQFMAALWAALNALVATEMSVWLALGIASFALTLIVAGAMLLKGRRWAFRVSVVLAVAVFVLGVVLCVIVREAPLLGGSHVLAGSVFLLCLRAGRAAVT